jgi:hypothetical protein
MRLWRERDHPRDHRGKFTDNPGGGSARAAEVDVQSSGGSRRMTDREFEERSARVEKVIGSARKTMATEITHMRDGAWTPERDQLHREIAADLYRKQSEGVPTDREAVIAGGLGGAGKSTVLRDYAGIDASRYVTLNPDDVKEVMADRGLMPEVPGHEDLSPMERAALVHEESSRITGLMADMAYRDGRNMIWDITMSSSKSVESRLDALDRHGYSDVTGIFVDIPTDVSVDRAMSRYRRGVDQFREGKGHGGRFVPPSIIRAQATSSGSTVNRQTFDGLRDRFSGWSVYDNSGRSPRPVAGYRPSTDTGGGRNLRGGNNPEPGTFPRTGLR